MLDKTDRHLLYELYWDCRQTHTALARKLRVSKQVVGYRINQLEKAGIIRSYHALIDWRRLGYNSIRIYLKWHEIGLEEEKRIYDQMKADPFFMWTVKFEGEFDVAFYLWVESIPEFSKKWFEFLLLHRHQILKQEIYESVNMVHYPMKPFMEKFQTHEKIIGDGSKADYDKTDYAILRGVTRDGKISLVDLAKEIRLTPKAIFYRLRRLEKAGIILGYNALIDVDLLGYQAYKIDFYLKDLTRLEEMHKFAKEHPLINARMRTIGGPDFEIETFVGGVPELKGLINEIRKRYGDCIDFYRFHRYETIKQVYLPGEAISGDERQRRG